MKKIFNSLIRDTANLNFGRDIIKKWCSDYIDKLKNNDIFILDVGVGAGIDLMNISKTCKNKNINMFGIEIYKPYIKKAEKNKIKIFPIDIEREPIPTEDEFFDIVIANQILEHTKEIFWVCSEISRVLKKGGIAIVGVPNLAALHNRILLFLGKQPASIRLLSAHVRGFTKQEFIEFITKDGYFKVIDFRGSGFYPFPTLISKTMSRLFPTFSVGIFFLLERTRKKGRFINILKKCHYETPYFQG